MITLITGTPGQGKSVYAVWNEIRTAIDAGRMVYYNGIPKLTLPAIQLTDAEILKWHELQPKKNPDDLDEHALLSNIQEGSLIVIDESQRIFRPMGSGAAIPESLAYLEYHRHHGLDFVLLTQHPKLVHVNVRALVGRHIHLRNGVLGRVSHEFGEWCENPQTKSARSSSLTRKNSLPKAAFALFESASIHVKQKKGVPVQFYLLGFIFLALPALGWYAYKSINKKIEPPPPVLESKLNTEKKHDNNIASAPVAVSTLAVQPLEYHASNQVDWSSIAGCIASKRQTACYDHNGVRVILPSDTVRLALTHGWPGRKVAEATQGGTTPGASATLSPLDVSSPVVTEPIPPRSYDSVVLADRTSGV